MRILISFVLIFSSFFFQSRAQDRIMRLVILPDTQSYLESCPEIMESQFKWLAEQASDIDYVLHVGDITQDNTHAEWVLASIYFDLINDKIPYAFSLGNHDFGSSPGKFADVRDSQLANKYFPLEKLKSNAPIEGAFEAGMVDNTYHVFENNGQSWLILALEFGPRDEVLDWANTVVESHPEHQVILLTHAYMYVGDKRQSEGDNWRAQAYGIGNDTGEKAVNDGEQIWEKLVKNHPNFLLTFSGHVLHEGYGRLVSEGKHGNNVYQFLANYQRGVKGYDNGCNGYLRIVDINLEESDLQVKTYSPWLDEWLENENHNFQYALD
jgi:predicted phosphodiesterase